MKLTCSRYSTCLVFQLFFLMCDIIFNCVSLFAKNRDGLLILFIFQDLFIVLSITTVLMSFFSTYLFQAGLVEVLLRRLMCAGSVCLLYLLTSVCLHSVWLMQKWNRENHPSSPILVLLLTLHRCLSPWYYFAYKRTALRFSDPRLYEDMDWLSQNSHY